jgi:hypothetical protein
MKVRVIQNGNPFLAWYHIFYDNTSASSAAPTDYTVLNSQMSLTLMEHQMLLNGAMTLVLADGEIVSLKVT